MNILKTPFLAALALLLAFVSLGQAQTTLTSTTLSTAITKSQKTITVASATNFNPPDLAQSQGGVGSSTAANQTVALIGREVVDIVDVSGTTITVRRGTRGSAAVAHSSGEKVTVGPAGNFADADPQGACTRTLLAYVPIINVHTGEKFDCMNGEFGSWINRPRLGAAVSSAATIAPISPFVHISGTAEITAITPPPAMPKVGCITVIPDGAFTGATGGAAGSAVAKAFTAVANKTLQLCYDGTSWTPGY